ncbi:MAG: hypothetical protein IKF19_03480 [Bacilli bacterium]|nr:hypothetical protein [Bacilli bacterium]
MEEISISKFINTLISVVKSSPSSFLFVILGIIFTIAMIINLKKHKTMGRTLYIIGWVFIVAFALIKYSSYLSKLFDNLINTIFREIFFPNLATFIIIISITNIIFLITILDKRTMLFDKIVNCAFFSAIMTLLMYILDQITKYKINVYEASEIYSNGKVLILIEATTILFCLWILIILSKFLIMKLIHKSDQKIKEEYEDKVHDDENILTQNPDTALNESNQLLENGKSSQNNIDNSLATDQLFNSSSLTASTHDSINVQSSVPSNVNVASSVQFSTDVFNQTPEDIQNSFDSSNVLTNNISSSNQNGSNSSVDVINKPSFQGNGISLNSENMLGKYINRVESND